ncbi:MAG: hypothetical protein AAF458_23320 [Pseudomonadota bacterium]
MLGLFDIVLKLAIGLFALAVAAVTTLFMIGDDELSPAVVEAMTDRPRLPAKRNAFYLIAGIQAPANFVPEEHAHSAVTRINAIVEDPVALSDPTTSDRVRHAWVKPDIGLSLPAGLICDLRAGACAAQLRKRVDGILKAAGDNALLLQRYERLTEFPEYRFDLRYRAMTPQMNGQTLTELHKLWLARALVNADVPAIYNDIAHLRTLIGQADHLLSKLALIDMLANSMHVYAVFTDAGPQAAALLPELLLFDEGAFDLEPSLLAEFRSMAHTILHSEESVRREVAASNKSVESLGSMSGYRAMFKPKRTVNFVFACIQEAIRRSARSIAPLELRPTCEIDPLEKVLNPIGAMVVHATYVEFSGVGPAIRDMDGLVVLVNAKRHLVAEATPPDQVDRFLRERRGVLFHPHTGEPVWWDQKSRELYFPGSSEEGFANLPYVPLPSLQ